MASLISIQRKKKCDNRPVYKRKRLFKAALAYYGITREDWVRAQDDLSLGYFEGVVHGAKTSPRVEGLIDDAINEFCADVVGLYERRLAARAA